MSAVNIEKNLQNLFFTALDEGIAKEESLIIVGLCLKVGIDVNMMSQPNAHRIRWTALMRAAQYSSVEVVQKLLDFGADVNLSNEKGMTSLMYSTLNPDKTLYKVLLKTADVNKETIQGWTVLMYAMQNRDITMAKDFLAAGANINQQDKKGQTCLIHRAMIKDTQGLVFLLNNKAAINHQDAEGWTALMYAIKRSHFDCAQVLLKFGADIFLKNNLGEDALSIAKSRENKKLLKLFEGLAPTTDTPLQEAEKILSDTPKTLVSENVIPTLKTKDSEAVMPTLKTKVSEDVILAIETKVSDAHNKDEQGLTALMDAVHRGKKSLCEKLLKEGMDINIQDNKGRTALMILTMESKETLKPIMNEILDTLLSYKPDVNLQDNKGKTALMYAVENNRTEYCIKKLINAGADITIKNNNGKTALNSAQGATKIIMNKIIQSKLTPNTKTPFGEDSFIFIC